MSPQHETHGERSEEGFVDVRGFRTWYRRCGDNDAPALVLLHGGPGIPGGGFRPLEALADTRPVVRYDQLGCGQSDRPADTSLWRIETFIEELDCVRRQLGLVEIHLLGHSWGATLALEYLLTRPRGVRSLILSSALFSTCVYAEETRRLCQELPGYVQSIMRRFEESPRAAPTESQRKPNETQPGKTPDEVRFQARVMKMTFPIVTSPVFLRLMNLASLAPPLRRPAYEMAELAFLRRYLCRLRDPPLELFTEVLRRNFEVYETLWGHSEFFPTGRLLDWDVEDRLGEIDVPTLILSGRYDECTPMQQERLQKGIPGSHWVLFEESAHLAFLEEPDRFRQVLGEFLDEVDRKSGISP